MRCQPLRDLVVDICSKFNQRCYFCAGPGDNPYPLCSGCEADLPWATTTCTRCALPLAFDGPLCSGCQNSPPPFEQTEAPWAYDFPLDAAIKRFKHRGDRPMGRLLGDRLGAWLLHRFNEGLPRPQRMLPVPLAAQRLRVRGFNQSQLLAERLSKSLGITVADHAVVRIRDTPSQQHLDLPARQRNLRGAFGLAPNASVRGLHLALVDDVMTTGATAHAIATLLRQAGARRVDVYCLARTPGPPRP